MVADERTEQSSCFPAQPLRGIDEIKIEMLRLRPFAREDEGDLLADAAGRAGDASSGRTVRPRASARFRKVDTGFRKRSCATNKLERDADSKKRHLALHAEVMRSHTHGRSGLASGLAARGSRRHV